MSNHVVINTHQPPIPCRDAINASLLVVLTKDNQGQLAAYDAMVHLPLPGSKSYELERRQNAIWIAHQGRKLTYPQAACHFHIEEENYRG